MYLTVIDVNHLMKHTFQQRTVILNSLYLYNLNCDNSSKLHFISVRFTYREKNPITWELLDEKTNTSTAKYATVLILIDLPLSSRYNIY